MGEDLARVLRQTDKKVKLFRSEVRVLATNGDAMLRYVDDKVAGPDDLRGCSAGRGPAAQLRADAGLELLDTEGLGDVVVGAGIERLYLHEVLVADGKDNDGDLRNSSDLAAQFNAAHLRHGEVGDDEVGFPCVYGFHSFETVGGDP